MPSDKPDRPRKLAQTAVSLCVLAALAGVAVGLLVKQSRFERPGREVAAAMSFEHLLSGALVPMSPLERFTPETLWEKINGQADFYIAAGLVSLNCQRFRLAADPDDWLELYVYDMGEWSGALAVFVPREESTAVDLTANAYESGGSVFFVHGRYYVEIRAAQPTEQLAEAGMMLARNFVADTEIDTASQLDPAELFPADHLVADSIKFKKANVFGFAGLDNVYTAVYGFDGIKATAYVSPRGSADEAKRLAEAYEQFLRDLGAGDIARPSLPSGGEVLELSGYYYVIFHHEQFMGGVNECRSSVMARNVANALYEHLSEQGE